MTRKTCRNQVLFLNCLPGNFLSAYITSRFFPLSCLLAVLKFLLITTCGLLSISLCAQKAQRPNIIFILTDDMGLGDIACFNGTYKTPNIDRMATEGRKFSSYYSASPICSPS